MEQQEEEKPNPLESDDSNALDGGDIDATNSVSLEDDTSTDNNGSKKDDDKKKVDSGSKEKKGLFKKIQGGISHVNIYMLLFILILVLVGVVAFASYQLSKKEAKKSGVNVQTLTQEALNDLVGNDAKVGDPKSILSIESNAVFAGKVLIKDSLDVAGTIKVGGSLSLPGISVTGLSQLDTAQIKSLVVGGDADIQGNIIARKNLTVSGSITVSGSFSVKQLNVDNLRLNQDLQIEKHIDAGGGTPGVGRGSAVGGAGTVSISGSDTAGTVTTNVGSGAPAGVLASVSFNSKFGGTPHVVITQVGGPTFSQSYLSSRTSSGFSIATFNSLGGSPGSYSFDYIVID